MTSFRWFSLISSAFFLLLMAVCLHNIVQHALAEYWGGVVAWAVIWYFGKMFHQIVVATAVAQSALKGLTSQQK